MRLTLALSLALAAATLRAGPLDELLPRPKEAEARAGQWVFDAAQVRGLTGGSNDDLDATVGGGSSPLVHLVRRAMRARDHELIGHAEGLELGGAALHNGKVGLGPHDDAYKRRLLCVLGHGSSLESTYIRPV